jgi:1-acyl-sn-glycerol-3-phosphate acyltransferase
MEPVVRRPLSFACWTPTIWARILVRMIPIRFRYRLAQVVLKAMGHLLFGYEVSGGENVPKDGAFLVAANHKSYLDPPLVGAGLPREICYFAKKELFRIPFIGSLIRTFGAIPVDRGGFDRRGLMMALDLVRSGQGLLVFPEGTRIRRPGFAEPKEGIGLLAVKSGAAVVPVLIRSTWEPRRSLFRRIPVRIDFGRPLDLPSAEEGQPARAHYERITRAVMEAIRNMSPGEGAPGPLP